MRARTAHRVEAGFTAALAINLHHSCKNFLVNLRVFNIQDLTNAYCESDEKKTEEMTFVLSICAIF